MTTGTLSHIKRIFKVLLVISAVVLTTAVAFTVTYYNQVAGEVDEAFSTYRWAVPSRVYSDRQPLFAGLNIQRQGVLARLERNGYRKVATIAGPGEYTISPTLLEIYQRALEHPSFGYPARRLRFTLAKDVIVRMEQEDSSEAQPILFLEPETLAVLVGESWQDRELVRIEDMPAAMTQAVVAMEDRRFFKHNGVDLQGIARALVKDVLRMRLAQGGSTLTQQVVKNIILKDASRTLSRKYREMVMAYIIDKEYSKTEILSKYLNEIYFGQDGAYEIRGLGAAARFYFGKPVEELSVSECAALAGVIHGPNRYVKTGVINATALTARRNQVLDAMFQVGYLPEAEMVRLKLEAPLLRSTRQQRRLAPYFIDLLKRRLRSEYSSDGLTQEGLGIYTTLQMNLQELAEKAVSRQLAQLESKYSRLRKSDPQQQLQAAVVLLRPATGEILALVGGRDYQTTPYDRIHQAQRQPGSLIKPFIYLTALNEGPDSTALPGGFGPLYPLQDTPTTFTYHDVEYTPNDYDKTTVGTVPAYFALSRSLNIPTVQLLQAITPAKVSQTLNAFGFSTPFADILPSALGVNEVYPIELARAYSALAAGGVLAEPRVLSSVVNGSGELLEHTPVRIVEAAPAASVAVLNGILKQVVDNGTARAVRAAGLTIPLAGKTGTTSNGKDAWFVGYSADLVGLVWVGFDDGTPLNLTGSQAALPIWLDIFQHIDLSGELFPLPENAEDIQINPRTGLQVTEGCPAESNITLTFYSDRLPPACGLAPTPVTATAVPPLQ
jgi:penicillin-binding protein 1B